MEPETELTQSWNSPELSENWGGLLKGIPLQIGGGEMRTFSLPMPLQDVDDGTDISLKDWQLGPPRDTTGTAGAPPFSIKPFKGSVRTRFTPVEPRLDEDPRGGGQSSPDHFETPVTTPRISSRDSSVSGDPLQNAEDSDVNNVETTSGNTPPAAVAFDVAAKEETTSPPDQSNAALRARSLRVSFKENSSNKTPHHRASNPPIVRHRSPLKSRSILPSKEVKALQPKWESSTKIRPEKTSSFSSKAAQVQAPLHGIKATRKVKRARASASAVPVPVPVPVAVPVPAASSEIEVEGPEFQSSSGYLSEGRYLSEYSGREQSMGRELEFGSNRLSRELTMSPIRKDPHFDSGRVGSPSLNRSLGGHRHAITVGDVDSDDEEGGMKGGMLCGGGLSDTKLSGDFVRLLSKLCRVSVPAAAAPKQQHAMSKSASSATRGRNGKFDRSNATSLSWDPSVGDNHNTTNNNNNKITILGRHDSLKLLSERCSTAPAPSYTLHKPRKIRDHEPHIHFYKTISKTLDQKLKS